MRHYDAQGLRLIGRELSPPFQLVLDAAPSCRNLTCTAILRHLPGKRLVCTGHRNHHRPCVAKIFLDPSGCERHYQRELSGIKALQAARIPTPELLFKGKLAEGHAPVLLFRHMTAHTDLSKYLASTASAENHFDALSRAVQAIARLHIAGLKQRDIHPGNFLLSAGDVMIIDGDDIEAAGAAPLPQKESLSNLALFLAQFYTSFDTLLPDLVTVYGASRNWTVSQHWQNWVRGETKRWRNWRLKKFLPKTKRSCTAFHAVKNWRRFIIWDRDWYTPTWQPLIENPDNFIESGTILKAGNSATVAKVTIDSQTVVVKRYNIKDAGHALRRCFRPSRAMVSWENAHRLRFLGINTPRPLAVIERRWGYLRQRAYFIMAHIEGVTLDQTLHEEVRDRQAIEGRLDELIALLEQLATARISHGDFKATNFLLSAGRLYLADLDGMRAHRSQASFRKAFHRDLKRLLRNWQNLPLVNQPLLKRLKQFIG